MKHLLRLLALAMMCAAAATAQQYTIKFATIAPKGTTWMNIMEEYDAAIRKESGGRLGFKIYAGGIQGDEKAVLRKIRANQLQCGGFTGVGMGEIAPTVRILDSPFLFNNTDEIDYIYKQYDAEFQKALEDGGYVLLGWAEVGQVYVFTNTPVKKREDLRGLKLWTWEGDPVAENAFRILGINPIPLSLTDVLTSLQTGLIDAVYNVPMALVSLQWHTRVKYMIDQSITTSAGAVLLQKKFYDQLPQDLKEILIRNGRQYMAKLTTASRKDNRDALAEIKKRNIQFLKVDPADVKQYEEVGVQSRRALAGKLYSADLLTRVEKSLADFRKTKKGGK